MTDLPFALTSQKRAVEKLPNKFLPVTPLKKVYLHFDSPRMSYSDRYIPVRNNFLSPCKIDLQKGLLSENIGKSQKTDNSRNNQISNFGNEKDYEKETYQFVLHNEVLGHPPININYSEKDVMVCLNTLTFSYGNFPMNIFNEKLNGNSNILQYRRPEYSYSKIFHSMSPIGKKSQAILKTPRKSFRKIPKTPFKILDAPDLQDDFYLNLVDWSSYNVVAVGLGNCVYLWNAFTSQVTKLCDLTNSEDSITSVCWMGKTQNLAVGTMKGELQIWDVHVAKKQRVMSGHSARIGTIASKSYLLFSGSRDRSILFRDARTPEQYLGVLKGHKQEVCGVRWSVDRPYIASGGNDNKLFVWDINNYKCGPLHRFIEHKAAIKALSWSPAQSGLLVSGGGTADRRIRFWNAIVGQPLQSVDTGSQICNIAWSKCGNELVSTHGYSQNHIIIWKYPSMRQITKLSGHSLRVLYLATSPCGQTIVTGAGDETLRFWNVFEKQEILNENNSQIYSSSQIR